MFGERSRCPPAVRFRRSTLAFASAVGIAVLAGRATDGRAGLSYDFTLGAGVQLNDNLYLDPPKSEGADQRQPVRETIYTLYPGALIWWHEERDQLQLSYDGEYWMFQGDEDRNSLWVNNLSANLGWRRWAPFFLEAGEALDRVPRTQQKEGEAVVDQINRNRLSVRTGLAWVLGPRGTAELAYRGEVTTFPGAGAADRVTSQYAEGLVHYRWSPLMESDTRLAYGQVSRELSADYHELDASMAVDQRLSELLVLRYRLEWVDNHEDHPAAAGAATGETVATVRSYLLKAAEIRGGLARGGSWNIAYEDHLENRVDGDTLKVGRAAAAMDLHSRLGSTLDAGVWYETRSYLDSGRDEQVWGPTLNSRWMITPWAACDLGVAWTHSTIRDEAVSAVGNRATRAAAALVVMISRHLQMEAGYQYLENDSTEALQSNTNNIFYAVVTYSFNPVPPGRLLPSHTSRLVVPYAPAATATGTQGLGGATTGH